jgi:shikimate kinase
MISSIANRATRIYLTGFMGSGKSTIGPILANTIGYSFVDLDAAVEAATGLPVSTIFQEQGERGFRLAERHALEEASVRSGVVVALGGGALTSPLSLDIVHRTGILVYLRASPDEIWARLRHKRDRPLLMGEGGEPLTEEALRERIRLLLADREPAFREADVIVDTNGGRLGLTVDRIVRKLAPYLPH